MSINSQLILPPKALSSCIAGCIVRDTRMVRLSSADRVNYFPAAPLYSATLILEGSLHLSPKILTLEDLPHLPAAPKRLFQPPCDHPHMSWSPGPVMALTIAFYPDAWQRLGGKFDGTPPQTLGHALSVLATAPLETTWPEFWHKMYAIWDQSAKASPFAVWSGSDRLKDWIYHLFSQLAQEGAGRSMRSAQRRLQRWTGHTKQTLEFFAKVEEVHRRATNEPSATPAQIAADAGFADQSHMGRAVKRATGFPPAQLNQKIATEEPFWCYRLLGERF